MGMSRNNEKVIPQKIYHAFLKAFRNIYLWQSPTAPGPLREKTVSK